MDSPKIKILFVDDEQEILQGLKRMARAMRHNWDVNFALGGAKALEIMAKQDFDILVTDMRMPGIDGVQLLQESLEHYPHMIRIVLSGQFDLDNFIRSGWPAHQFLSKPCDTNTLKKTISQTFAMRELLENSRLKDLVTRANFLPSLPSLYLEIEQELRSTAISMQKIGDIIAQDVAMTAKVLQLVNSPIFGCRRKIKTPTQAVVMLGVDVIKSLSLYLQTYAVMPTPAGVSLERLSKQGIAVGALAREIAKMEGKDDVVCSDAFLAGILQNIGRLIILSGFPEAYKDITAQAHEKNMPVWKVEQQVLGASHAEIGAYLIALWGLPTAIVESVAYHNTPSQCSDKNASFALTAVHVANALEKEPGLDASVINNDLDLEYLKKKGLTEHLPRWQQLYQKMKTS